jgi:hypothetical protein
MSVQPLTPIEINLDATVGELKQKVIHAWNINLYGSTLRELDFAGERMNDHSQLLSDTGLSMEASLELSQMMTNEQAISLLPIEFVTNIQKRSSKLNSTLCCALMIHYRFEIFAGSIRPLISSLALPSLSDYECFALLEHAFCTDEQRGAESAPALDAFSITLPNRDLSIAANANAKARANAKLDTDDWSRMLIDAGWNIDFKGEFDAITPLINAVRARNIPALEMLLDAGANVSLTTTSGISAWDEYQTQYPRHGFVFVLSPMYESMLSNKSKLKLKLAKYKSIIIDGLVLTLVVYFYYFLFLLFFKFFSF